VSWSSHWSHADALVRKGEAIASDSALGELLNSNRMADTLAELYPQHPLLVLDGIRMPVWAVPIPPDQRDTIDSILGRLAAGTPPGELTYPYEYCPGGAPSFWRKHEQRRLLPESGRHRLTSNPTYSLSRASLDSSGRLTLDCHLGRYFTHLATTRALGHEIVGRMCATRGTSTLAALPMREWLHAHVSDPVMDGSRRNAAVGHSTLVVVRRRGGGYHALLPTRSGDPATDAHVRHVCPAGMFQPFSDSAIANVADFSLEANFRREYAEELFAMESAERLDGHFDEFDSVRHVPLARLKNLLDTSPGSSLRIAGFCVNLLTLQPEVCLLLVIDDPDWLRDEARVEKFPLKYGWEIAAVTDHEQSDLFELDHQFKIRTKALLQPSNLVPQAAAALKLGLDLMRSDRLTAS